MKKNLVIFDADSMIFIVASRHKRSKIANMVKTATGKFIKSCIEKCESNTPGETDYIGFYGSKEDDAKPNYRYALYPEYKSTRKPPQDFVTKWRPTIHSTFKDKWGFVPVDGMEADDAVGIAYAKYKDQYENIYIVTNDKDMKQFPNVHVYMMNTHDIEFFDEFTARKCYAEQMLKGDSVDTIPGLFGIGEKKAESMLAECTTVPQLKWTVLRAYAGYEDELRKKGQRSIKKADKEKLVEEVRQEAAAVGINDLTEEQIARKVNVRVKAQVEAFVEEKMPGGWRDHIILQNKLLGMLSEMPEDEEACSFEFPEPIEFEIIAEETVAPTPEDDILGL